MFGQPISMNIPDVVGFELIGALKEGITATDLVLTITKILRENGVVGKFVEFYGNGLSKFIFGRQSNNIKYGTRIWCNMWFFSTDKETINYLELTGKDEHQLEIVKKYSTVQNLDW